MSPGNDLAGAGRWAGVIEAPLFNDNPRLPQAVKDFPVPHSPVMTRQMRRQPVAGVFLFWRILFLNTLPRMSKARPHCAGVPAKHSQRQNTAPKSATQPAGKFGRRLLVCLLLAAVTFAVFWPVTGYDFVNYDDNLYVTGNAQVRGGLTLEGTRWAFTTSQSAYWHPLTWFSHMLDCQFWGLNAGGHHLTSLLFHAANTILLFLVLHALTRAFWPCAFVAALFALHPLGVESVAWVAQRKNVLSTFFWLLTMGAYLRYVRRPNWRHYLLMIVCYALGLMAKPMLVTLPCVLLLLDYWPLQRFKLPMTHSTFWPLVREKLPLLLLAMASSILTYLGQRNLGVVTTLEQSPLLVRLAKVPVNYGTYLRNTIWPEGLVVPYPYLPTFSVPVVMLCLLLLAGLTLWSLWRISSAPYVPIGWFWFLGTLIPVIGLVQVGETPLADRFTYVPQIGLYLALAFAAREAMVKWRLPRMLVGLVAGLVLAGCVMQTRRQLSYWQNSETLIRRRIAVTKNNATAYYDLGCYLESKGQIAPAMENYQLAVRISPNYTKSLNNIGRILANEGHLDEAIEYYNRALQFDPNHLSALNNLGAALAAKRQFTEAMARYEKVLRLDPNFVYARYNLGVALEAEGRWEEAVGQYTEALRLQPDYWQAHNNLGYLLMLHGRQDEAVPHFLESLRLNPKQPDAHFNLGNALAMQQKYEEAATHFAESLKLSPNYAPAHKNLGMALARLGRREEAVSHLQEAIRLKPDYEEAMQQLRALGAQKEE
jgi:tetratricopeptide (TPR) repeat protein